MKFPPGPPPDLEMLEPHRQRLRRNPIDFFRRMARDHGNLSYVRIAGRDVYFVCEARRVREMLGCPALAKGYGVGTADRARDEGEAAEHERWVGRFAARHMRRPHLLSCAPLIVEQGLRHQAGWAHGALIDARDSMRALSLDIIGTMLFGAAFDQVRGVCAAYCARFLEAAGPPLGGLEAPLPAADFAEVEGRLDAAIGTLAAAYGAGDGRPAVHEDGGGVADPAGGARGQVWDPVRGWLGALCAMRDGDAAIPPAQVREIAVLLLLAGHETAATLLCWCWLLLARDEDVQAAVHDEIDGVPRGRLAEADDVARLPRVSALLSEALRLFPPGWIISRTAREAFELDGYSVRQGALVLTSPLLLQRDVRYFENPDAFDPARWSASLAVARGAYLPFGLGPRRCVGESLAWMEAGLLVATLAARWRFETVEEIDVGLAPMLSLRPAGPVWLRLRRRGVT